MPDVRGKFTVVSHKKYSGDSVEVELNAVYGNSPEDNTYSLATPSGHITMYVTNPAAIEKLPIGQAFYVDFTAVPK
jgi:hypothetical protein